MQNMNLALMTGGSSLGLVVLGWVYYLSQIPKEKVPARPVMVSALMVWCALSVIGIYALLIVQGTPPDLLSWILGANAVVLAAFFLYLLTQAPMPDQPIKVVLGEPLPNIEAIDANGKQHSSQDWQGQRILFKFFRGHW